MLLSRSDDAVIRVHNGRVDPVQTRENEPQSVRRTLLRLTCVAVAKRRNALPPLDYSQATIRKTRLMLIHQQQLPV